MHVPRRHPRVRRRRVKGFVRIFKRQLIDQVSRAAFSGNYRLLSGSLVVVVAFGAGRADKPCRTAIRAASVRLRAWSF